MVWVRQPATSSRPERLYFGVDESDHLSHGFECSPGSGRVRMIVWSEFETDRPVAALASGAVRKDYSLVVARGEDTSFATVETAVADPVLQAFARSGALGLALGEEPEEAPAPPEEISQIREFWRACGAAR